SRSREDLLAPLQKFDALDAPAGEAQPLGERAGQHRQVGTVHGRTEKRLRRIPAHAVFLVYLVARDAAVVAPVEIVGPGYAGLVRRPGEGSEPIPPQLRRLDAPLPALPVLLVRAAPVVLGLHEYRQHVLPLPPGVAGQLRPLVVVARLAAEVQHRIDRRRAA